MELDGLLTIEEAAQYLRVSPWTIRGWLSKKLHGLTAKRSGRRILFERSALVAFVEASTAAAEKAEEVAA